jgi:FlaA1/EpsC-like NDP-sugar epimerase
MTIPEAALLVLQSGGISQGGETFVLDMGEPIRIRDLAAELIRLHGGDPEDASNYRYIGLGPGEKLHESLVCDDELAEHVTEHIMRVVCCTEAVDEATVDGYLRELEGLVNANAEERVLERLFAICNEAESTALREEPATRGLPIAAAQPRAAAPLAPAEPVVTPRHDGRRTPGVSRNAQR